MVDRAGYIARLLKAATPTMLGLIGVLILSLPVRLAEGFFPTPLLPMVVVFFWSIYAPSYLPAYSVFLIGLLQDFLTGGPLGLWPAVYLSMQMVVSTQRPYFQGREQRVVWLGFAFSATVAALMVWLVMSLFSGTMLPLRYLALQILATIAFYPVFATGFAHLHRRVIVEA